jgi:hypothetical protein
MTKQERLGLIEQLNSVQAAIDAALDRLVAVEKAPKPTKKKPGKKA